ncbi:MAG: NHL repeat-containing protein [Desulfuromonadales bacterium]
MRFLSFVLLSLVSVLVTGGCASAPKKEAVRILWPPLPQEPRLEWIKNYYSEDNLGKTDAQKTAEMLLGKPPLHFFKRPSGIAADGKGKVYVADAPGATIYEYDLVANKFRILTPTGLPGLPYDMAVDSQGRIYVALNNIQQILVLSPEGQQLFTIGGNDLLTLPSYLALNERLGRIYVSDAGAHKVAVFDFEGKYLFSFGRPGSADGELNGPMGLAIAKDGTVFVAEQFNARVQAFDADGKFLHRFGERGDRSMMFEGPKDIVVDSDGNLHILDVRKSAMLSFKSDGTPLLYTGSGSGASIKATSFFNPVSIWIDGNDQIYIADSMNRRFSVWRYLSDAYLATDPFGIRKR